MQVNFPTGPIAHIGISAVLSFVFRLNPFVTVFCGILPDLVDKPLDMFGIGSGRFIGHSLLFVVVVIAAFFIWKRKFGLAALVGLGSHLVLDLNSFIPWFYPFKHYDFPASHLSISAYLKSYLTFSGGGFELIVVVVAASIAFLGLMIYRRQAKKKAQRKTVPPHE
jgi:hypothetical protein